MLGKKVCSSAHFPCYCDVSCVCLLCVYKEIRCPGLSVLLQPQ